MTINGRATRIYTTESFNWYRAGFCVRSPAKIMPRPKCVRRTVIRGEPVKLLFKCFSWRTAYPVDYVYTAKSTFGVRCQGGTDVFARVPDRHCTAVYGTITVSSGNNDLSIEMTRHANVTNSLITRVQPWIWAKFMCR